MEDGQSRSSAWETRWYRWVAGLVSTHDPETLRRSGFATIFLLFGSAVGLLSAIVHFSAGDTQRALFTACYGFALLPLLFVMRWKRGPELAIHLALVLVLFGFVVSPFLAPRATPLPVGVVVLPCAAAVAIGARAGLAWTILSTLVLVAVALEGPLERTEQTLAWNLAIVCGSLGIAVAWTERGRRAALRAASRASSRMVEEATTRQAAEESMRESQALFATVFRRTPSMLVLADIPDGRILDVNESFVSISGWTADEAIGKTLTDLDAWPTLEDRDRLQNLLFDASLPEYVEIRLRRKSGDFVHLLASAEILQIDGEPALLAQAIDISERKHAQDAIAQYQRELELRVQERSEQLRASVARLEEQKRLVTVGTLAAGIAHQINNPVASIIALAELALVEKDDVASKDRHAVTLARILDEATRCGRIVKSVLQFARKEPTAKWVDDLNETVERAASLTREYVDERGCELVMSLAERPLWVLMSPIEIEQVVINLLRNAAESRDSGVRIELSTRAEEDLAILSIIDDGRGIPDENHSRIVDPFFTTRLDEGGTGLGLSVVHGIVVDHDGVLLTDSPDCGGTRVEVKLPLRLSD